MWKLIDDPPDTDSGKWSRRVIVITNLGNLTTLSFFGNKIDGVWQRPGYFINGEEPALWTEIPKLP